MSSQTVQIMEKTDRKPWSRFVLPRVADMLFVAVFIGVIALGPRLMNMDGDLGRHLTIGGYILDELTIPTRDIFSHSMSGVHLTPHEWFAQVLFALSYRAAGLDGVVVLCALVLAATFTIVYKQALSRSQIILVALSLTVLAAAAASVHWLARPHIFTLLFTVLWMGELERWRRGDAWRWWSLPLIMLVWVNTHGAFIVGIVIWLVFLVGSWVASMVKVKWQFDVQPGDINSQDPERIRQLLLAGLPVLFVTIINPAGLNVWSTTFGFLQNQYLVSHTVEYQAPNFQDSSFWPFLLMICLSLLLLALNRRGISLAAVLLLVSWTAFSLVSARNIAIYAVIAAPILAGICAAIIEDNHLFKGLVNYDQRLQMVNDQLAGYTWPAVICTAIGLSMFFGAANSDMAGRNRFHENVFPVAAVDWMADHPTEEPIFNYFPWGGYLLYRMWPDQKVFIDGQTDFYGEELTREYDQVISLSEGWQFVLNDYQIGRVLMPVDAELIGELTGSRGWEVAYRDQIAAVLDFKPDKY